ncbi:MAG TPA: GAP family protein [Solirubrobacteraceae bacterium]|nr:GAP family protein [Solirubrobacteraceae bacterium]
MADAIGQVLAFAVVVSLSPIPIIAVVLMLGTPRARVNGPAFLLGWVLGLSIVGAIVLVVVGSVGATEGEEPATWVSVLKIVLGVLLVLVAARQWRGRGRGGDEEKMPSWMRSIDHFTAGRSIAVAAVLAGVNPKNLLLTVGAAAAIAGTGVDTAEQVIALAVFVFVATLGPGAVVAIYFVLGERAKRMLDDLKLWMAAHNAAIMAAICLVIGAKLIGDGVSGLG